MVSGQEVHFFPQKMPGLLFVEWLNCATMRSEIYPAGDLECSWPLRPLGWRNASDSSARAHETECVARD
jgi:hypothetical protein